MMFVAVVEMIVVLVVVAAVFGRYLLMMLMLHLGMKTLQHWLQLVDRQFVLQSAFHLLHCHESI